MTLQLQAKPNSERTMRKSRKTKRRAVEAVEIAICLPMLVLTTFAAVDICNVIHLKQVANSIAFETVRKASNENGSFEEAVLVGKAFATARGMNQSNVTVQAQNSKKYPNRASMPTGEIIRGRVTLPVKGNVSGPYILFKNTLISSQNIRIAAR